MTTMRTEMEARNNNSCLLPLGKSNMNTVFLKSVGTSVGTGM